jgi:REP element-mobilizing transposase RayT
MNRVARPGVRFDEPVADLLLQHVAQLPERFGLRVHGYALMPNHYHLLIESPLGNLSEAMRYLGAAFTQAWNRACGTDGAVFRGRFKNRMVESDAYWMHLLAYLHLNPVRAHLVGRPADSDLTSHRAYLGLSPRPDWLTVDELLAAFGSADALATYVDDVHRKRRPAPAGFDPDRLWRPSLSAPVPEPPPLRRRAADEALADVAALTGVPVEALFTRSARPTPNPVAWLATWWLRRGAFLTQPEVARIVGVGRARVGQIEARLHELARLDGGVARWMAALEAGRRGGRG